MQPAAVFVDLDLKAIGHARRSAIVWDIAE
jgi:hypothetical protein